MSATSMTKEPWTDNAEIAYRRGAHQAVARLLRELREGNVPPSDWEAVLARAVVELRVMRSARRDLPLLLDKLVERLWPERN